MNIMLVVYCAILIVFVFFSSKVTDLNKTRQADLERTSK